MMYFIFLAALFLAHSNGANDNFKGEATLFGSETSSFKDALNWASITTALGSVVYILFASDIIIFFGNGLVPDTLHATPEFAISVTLPIAVLLGSGIFILIKN